MSLTVAVQMDPLEKIGIAGDLTFALMLKAQERGHRLFHYLAEDLYEDGRVRARARPVNVKRVEGDHFSVGDRHTLDLATDVDVVLMRQDPPFDIGYITATYLLERVARTHWSSTTRERSATRPKSCSCLISLASCRRR